MALIACAECNKQISDKAATCPQCGAPISASRQHAVPAATATKFADPVSGSQVDITSAGVWTFLFGPFYFAHRQVWSHAAISFAVAFVTWGISWLGYPFFAQRIVRNHLIAKGGQAVQSWPGPMPSRPTTFDCPIAKKIVTFTASVVSVRPGLPPVAQFKSCTGLATCGVEARHADGPTYDWGICPMKRNMN